MPKSVEIKARVSDLESLKKIAQQLSGKEPTIMHQHDLFFNVPHGRLKLRKVQGQKSQLMYYDRSDQPGPKVSDYNFHYTDDPMTLEDTLCKALGARGHVEKVRYLYLIGQTRVHIDLVEGLGGFIELEVILDEGQTVEEGQAVAYDLMHKLGVNTSDLLSCSYVDMLLNKTLNL